MSLKLRLAAALAGTPIALAAASAPAAEVETLERIAVVDVQRCILETKEGKKAKDELQKKFVKHQSRLEKKAKDLEKKYMDLQAKAAMLGEPELRKRQQDIMRGQSELEELNYNAQQEVAEREALLTEQIYNKVAAIVKQIALEEKVQIVLVRSEMTVLWADPRLDLTNRVILKYDKEHK
jgi:outer membrane protein